MHFGVSLPNIGEYSDPALVVDLARLAEDAGWEAVFLWDAIHVEMEGGERPAAADPWIALAAMATATNRVRLGPIVLPLARRRPWKVAKETATLDQLSGGRLILPVGYGAIDDGAFSRVGEETDRRARAQRVEEGLEILTGLWSGEPFAYDGECYHLEEMTFLPRPVQSPRIPIWLDAAWPRMRSMRRAIRYDGIIAGKRNEDGTGAAMTPDDYREMKAWIEANRPEGPPIDIVREEETPGDDRERAAEVVQPFAEAGVTWWIEAAWVHVYRGTLASMRERIRQGPPRRE
jgi:hypothetical protein